MHETRNMIVITRDGRTTVVSGWRATLLGVLAALVIALVFCSITLLLFGVAITFATLLLFGLLLAVGLVLVLSWLQTSRRPPAER
jgi:hypothetical protein